MSKYNVRKNGKFVKLRRGSLYDVNGVTARFRGTTPEGKHKFTAHKIFEAEVDLTNVNVSTIDKDKVKSYLS